MPPTRRWLKPATTAVSIGIIQDNADWGDYKTEFELASDAGQASDIVVSGTSNRGLGPAGYLVDVTGMLGDYPEFDDVIDALWASTEWNGKRLGCPARRRGPPAILQQDAAGRVGLERRGYREPAGSHHERRVFLGGYVRYRRRGRRSGHRQRGQRLVASRRERRLTFCTTTSPLVARLSARADALIFDKAAALKVYEKLSAAVERGILSDTRLDGDWTGWHTGITEGEVLFAYGGSWNWADWATNYVADRGGEDYLWEHFGFAAIPGMENCTGEPTTLTHPLIYMVSSSSEHPDLALLLISKATVKELNTDYAIASGHLGVLKSQADYAPYVSSEFLTQVLPLLDVTTFLPNSPHWSALSSGYYEGILAAESGLSAQDALDIAVDYLENELGDNVVICD